MCGVSFPPLQDDVIISHKLLVSKDIINPLGDANHLDKLLLILDNMYLKAAHSQSVVKVFIKGRHSNLSAVMITQNLFMERQYARDISLNANHFILLRMRDLGEVEYLFQTNI